ncbi:MAG: nuclear transport factor 2 family protein [Acidobacteria bacterium]|nr:nuclear transport factor 2 family protein [Acidobacteriota bacterium]
MRRQRVLVVGLSAGFLLMAVHFARAQRLPDTATEVAAAYLEAMEASDLDRAEALFAGESSVFESGGVEGTWQHYREHHIGAELEEIASFTIAKGEPDEVESVDGSMAFVTWPIEYTIELKEGRMIESKGTVTFVFLREEGQYRIRHLHWSSRRKVTAEG